MMSININAFPTRHWAWQVLEKSLVVLRWVLAIVSVTVVTAAVVIAVSVHAVAQ